MTTSPDLSPPSRARSARAAAALSLALLGGCGGATGGDAQTPPTTGRTDIESWLAAGFYRSWRCEAAAHVGRTVSGVASPHGLNRICSNSALGTADPMKEAPVGAAGVKELYAVDGKTLVGYAVYLHTRAGSTGDTWYWYERVPLDSSAPHDSHGVVADGFGGSGAAATICVGCHKAATQPPYVFTQVK